MEGNNAFLPDEIIVNILTRLPVKSLIRFQCVCKKWKKIFKDPLFITDHLNHSTDRNPSLLLPLPSCRTSHSHFHLYLLGRDLQLREIHNSPLMNAVSVGRIIGSSNGLVCLLLPMFCLPLRTFPGYLLVWNPATREERLVPGTKGSKGESFCGFGFSPIANDYKIVRIYRNKDHYDPDYRIQDIRKCVNGVEVYSLNTGIWKRVEFGDLEQMYFCTDSVTIDGIMFWPGFKDVDGHGRCHFIVSFDIALESFTLIAMPSLDPDLKFVPSVFENKLALLSHTGNFKACILHMWIMEEGTTSASGERWSLSEKYISRPYPYALSPMTIWRNEIVGMVLAMPEHFRKILSEAENDVTNFVLGQTECEVEGYQEMSTALSLVNLTSDESKLFVINKWEFLYGINYTESLVSVGKPRRTKRLRLEILERTRPKSPGERVLRSRRY